MKYNKYNIINSSKLNPNIIIKIKIVLAISIQFFIIKKSQESNSNLILL